MRFFSDCPQFYHKTPGLEPWPGDHQSGDPNQPLQLFDKTDDKTGSSESVISC